MPKAIEPKISKSINPYENKIAEIVKYKSSNTQDIRSAIPANKAIKNHPVERIYGGSVFDKDKSV
jgi:hypothetical protein